MDNLLERQPEGLYCAAGNFYIDPWTPVERAVITHAHADHLCPGSKRYLTTRAGETMLRARVGTECMIDAVEYGAPVNIGGVRVSLHPAGHIRGSAQIRLERAGEIWVVSGDYKLTPDPTCAPFEPIRCQTFVTESTFGLPIFRWPEASEALAGIHEWWEGNQRAGKASVLFAYPLGKAQRVLASLYGSIAPIYTHGAVERFNHLYRDSGVAMAATQYARSAPPKTDWSRALIVAPPLPKTSPWLRRFGDFSTGLASGWMRIRGTRRRQSIDRGFVLSDHADWPGLLTAIRSSGASRIWVTHGYRAQLARWLEENGLEAHAIDAQSPGGRDDAELPAGEAEP